MRKLLLVFLLPMLLLLSQQGRLAHELGHEIEHLSRVANSANSANAANAAGASAEKTPRPVQDKLCESCLSFAHLGAAARSEPLLLSLRELGSSFASSSRHAAVAARALAARSRGPPPSA